MISALSNLAEGISALATGNGYDRKQALLNGDDEVIEKQRSDGGTTREKILDVATELFDESGYDGTPLSLIASKLDFTKAALYYHFKSKLDILMGILDPLLSQIDELVESAPQRFTSASERWEFMVAYSELLLSHERAVRVLASSGIHASLPPEVRQRIARHRVRTTELAMLPGMSEEDQVKAILLVDMLHREMVFERDRLTVDGMTSERRREIVYAFIYEALNQAILRKADVSHL